MLLDVKKIKLTVALLLLVHCYFVLSVRKYMWLEVIGRFLFVVDATRKFPDHNTRGGRRLLYLRAADQ